MPTNKPWKLKALQMVHRGKSIAAVSETLGVEYWQVHEYICEKQDTDWSSWLGAKVYITHRLKKMVASDDPDERECLRQEVAKAINYLHKLSRKLGKKVDSA